jgi:hypothetical protein
MSLFIRQENQTILWNTIQNVDLFNMRLSPKQQPIWFKEIIGLFYEKYKGQKLSKADLENINRNVLAYMINKLEQMNHPISFGSPSILQQHSAVDQQMRMNQPKQYEKHVSFDLPRHNQGERLHIDLRPEYSSNLEKKTIQNQQYVSEFGARQQEYEQMVKREIPDIPSFKEEINEDVIKNMDELLEQQRKQRELDIKPIFVQPLSQMSESLNITETDGLREGVAGDGPSGLSIGGVRGTSATPMGTVGSPAPRKIQPKIDNRFIPNYSDSLPQINNNRKKLIISDSEIGEIIHANEINEMNIDKNDTYEILQELKNEMAELKNMFHMFLKGTNGSLLIPPSPPAKGTNGSILIPPSPPAKGTNGSILIPPSPPEKETDCSPDPAQLREGVAGGYWNLRFQ